MSPALLVIFFISLPSYLVLAFVCNFLISFLIFYVLLAVCCIVCLNSLNILRILTLKSFLERLHRWLSDWILRSKIFTFCLFRGSEVYIFWPIGFTRILKAILCEGGWNRIMVYWGGYIWIFTSRINLISYFIHKINWKGIVNIHVGIKTIKHQVEHWFKSLWPSIRKKIK